MEGTLCIITKNKRKYEFSNIPTHHLKNQNYKKNILLCMGGQLSLLVQGWRCPVDPWPGTLSSERRVDLTTFSLVHLQLRLPDLVVLSWGLGPRPPGLGQLRLGSVKTPRVADKPLCNLFLYNFRVSCFNFLFYYKTNIMTILSL